MLQTSSGTGGAASNLRHSGRPHYGVVLVGERGQAGHAVGGGIPTEVHVMLPKLSANVVSPTGAKSGAMKSLPASASAVTRQAKEMHLEDLRAQLEVIHQTDGSRRGGVCQVSRRKRASQRQG